MPPRITITDTAAAALREALNDANEADVVHLTVTESFEHGLDVGPKTKADEPIESNGIALLVEATSVQRANGIVIDYVETAVGAGFRIDNPNAPATIIELGPQEMKEQLDSGTIKVLVDVRTTWERNIAVLGDSLLLDEESGPRLAGLPRDTPIAFYCHHGIRSRAAGTQFLQQGFTKVYNLTGGIDAWSTLVDPSVPKY